MKSNALPKGFPSSPEQWEKLIATAPERVNDLECPYDPNDAAAVEAFWKDAVVVRAPCAPNWRKNAAGGSKAKRCAKIIRCADDRRRINRERCASLRQRIYGLLPIASIFSLIASVK
ncbi:MAG: hypothetical protein EPN21_13975 [Methylococcaceae bacterium]|nr:MAG: hypothetical protein EPN21_13975 [Methylococcaceae bacterium]